MRIFLLVHVGLLFFLIFLLTVLIFLLIGLFFFSRFFLCCFYVPCIVPRQGDNFGPLADSTNSNAPADPGGITVSYSNSIGYSYEQPLRCEVVTAHTLIKCKTVAGVSKDFRWVVNVAGQISNQSSSAAADTTFYTLPVITSLSGPGAYNANTAGGQKFYIEGT